MRIKLGLLFILSFCSVIHAQQIFRGKITDKLTGFPVYNAQVSLNGNIDTTYTDFNGNFTISQKEENADTSSILQFLNINNDIIHWKCNNYISITIIDAGAKKIYYKSAQNGSVSLTNFADGIFICKFDTDGKSYQGKIIKVNGKTVVNIEKSPISVPLVKLKINVKCQGFISESFELNNKSLSILPLETDTSSGVPFSYNITRNNTYLRYSGAPLIQSTGNIKSVKILFDIRNNELYYINSKKYDVHYNFAKNELGYQKSGYYFNQTNYDANPNRDYYLLSVDYYAENKKFVLEAFAANELTCDDISIIYNRVKATSFFGDSLKFAANSLKWNECNNIPLIDVNDLFENQKYQGLNAGHTFGYLRKIDISKNTQNYFGRHDIVLLKTIPVDLTVVAGIITNEMQTPLSHLNVLSKNRGTPNMSFKNSWNNEVFDQFNNQLIYLKVERDTFFIRHASIEEAEKFWNDRESRDTKILEKNSIFTTITTIDKIDINDISVFGAKASNLGELNSIKDEIGFNIPENAFAIPFYYYINHILENNIEQDIEKLLNDSIYKTNINLKEKQLRTIREKIIAAPINDSLVTEILQLLNNFSNFNKFRFRSSTNAEDISGFNGAGLYTSCTTKAEDGRKGIEDAVKSVWASLWNLRAFEEREYFCIDQRSVAMGILVHRSFPDEEANGVVITKNIYFDGIRAITINAQIKDISIVNAANGFTPECILFYTFKENPFNEENIEYITHSNVFRSNKDQVLETAEIVELARICYNIKTHYYYDIEHSVYPGFFRNYAVDIEFKIDMSADNIRHIYIKQTRPFN